MDIDRLNREELAALLQQLLAKFERERDGAERSLAEQGKQLLALQGANAELARQNRELRGTQAELAALYRAVPVALVTLDVQGRVLALNELAVSLLGVPGERARGAAFTEIAQLAEPRQFAQLLARCEREASGELERRVQGRRFVQALITRTSGTGLGDHEFQCALIDATERRALEHERERVHEDERRLHRRFELLDQINFEISSALAAADRLSFEAVLGLIVERALALFRPVRATIQIEAQYASGRAIEVSRTHSAASRLAGGPELREPLRVGRRQIGELSLRFDEPAALTEHARTFELFAQRVAPAVETARLNELEARERARLVLLNQASRELSECSDLESTERALLSTVNATVPEFARAAATFSCDGSGTWQLIGCTHVDPRVRRLLERLRRALERGLSDPTRPGATLTLLGQSITLDPAKSGLAWRLVERLGCGSLIGVPLQSGQRVIGAAFFGRAESPQELDPHVIQTLRELSANCAGALERSLLLEELRTAVDSRETLLAMVSHDLRSPLTAISTTARVLSRPPQVPERRRSGPQIELIQRSVARMSHLVDDLLSTSQIEGGQFLVELGSVDACAMLREAVELNMPVIVSHGLSCEHQCPEDLPALVADRQRLMQVFTNLLSNAVKFTPRGGQVRVTGERSEGCVKFAVIDTGPGIPAHQRTQVFSRYWTGRAKRSGLGLGLYIAERIVEAHGGRIWVEGAVGNGAAFYFTVPFEESSSDADDRPSREFGERETPVAPL